MPEWFQGLSMRGAILFALCLLPTTPVLAEVKYCYLPCDISFSECYSGCQGQESCRKHCAEKRFSCLDPCVPSASELERELIALTNVERAAVGAPPLAWNPRLARSARAHAAAMARGGRMVHAMDGDGPGDRMTKKGYHSQYWGENIAAGIGDGARAEAVVEWWMSSPPHRANLLNPRFVEIGVGTKRSRDGRVYFCQNFGNPAPAESTGAGPAVRRNVASVARP